MRWAAIALLVTGCATVGAPYPKVVPYTDTVEAAIAQWPGGLSERCAAHLRTETRLHVTWGQAFMDECGWREDSRGRRPLGAGCTKYDGRTVVAQPQTPEVWAHEVLHVLAACELGDLDHGHRSPGVWGSKGLEGRLRELWR
jgi:hypothetical protein